MCDLRRVLRLPGEEGESSRFSEFIQYNGSLQRLPAGFSKMRLHGITRMWPRCPGRALRPRRHGPGLLPTGILGCSFPAPSHVLQRMDKALPYPAPSGEVTREAPRVPSAGGGAVDGNTCPPCGNRDKAPPCARPPRINHDGKIPSMIMTLPQPVLGHPRSKFSNSYEPTRPEGTPVVPSQQVSLGSGDQPDQRCVCQCFCRSQSWWLN